ncbi:hypothetical protein LAZ40_11900 [Cereibacter sphaeroides]|uniref:hypothetical protein n=1 Tax=Cereibacter sphaeroides TaxID=1063 RepID=UPI001F3A763D|nr:hypothetical protein [Cereibacter sphaeroides]MCE6959723.1 hypothetical protein [Cereibacter sphaeroides]MCE6974416.1 hypothetical protein [Cereibacter sphaeroides]
MKALSRIALAGMASTLVLASCAPHHAGFEKGTADRVTARADALADKGATVRHGGTVDAGRAFYGREAEGSANQYGENHGKAFPQDLERPDALELVTPEPVSVKQIQTLVQELSGINVVVRTRYQSGDEQLDIPINDKIRINHKGSLSSLARTIAAHFDLSWTYDGETLTFDRMATRTYDIPLPSSSGTLATTLSGVNVAGNSVSTAKNMAIDPWKELQTSLESVVTEPGKVTISPNSGQVTIFASASAQAQAAEIVKTFDQLYSRRIGIEIATFYVDTSKSAELNADLGVSISSGDVSASLGQGLASAVQGGFGVISGNDGSVSFNLRDLAGSNAVADYQMSNTVAQNGVVAPVVLTNSKKYVSKISAATEDTGATVETDDINSGISIYALPRLMKNGKIHLSVWVTQSELNSLETFNTGNGYVQLPDADQRAMEFTLTMEPGETLVLGGYEKERSVTERESGIGALGALGVRNNHEGNATRTRMVLMVRPTIIGG